MTAAEAQARQVLQAFVTASDTPTGIRLAGLRGCAAIVLAALDTAGERIAALTETNAALTRSAIGNRDGRWAAEGERDTLRREMEAVRAELRLIDGRRGTGFNVQRALAADGIAARALKASPVPQEPAKDLGGGTAASGTNAETQP